MLDKSTQKCDVRLLYVAARHAKFVAISIQGCNMGMILTALHLINNILEYSVYRPPIPVAARSKA